VPGDPGDPGNPGGPGGPGGSGAPGFGCHDDSQCPAGEVCARTSACFKTSDVQAVHVDWTVHGMAADQATCSTIEDLEIQFSGSGPIPPHLGFAPVPCVEGKFSIDKLPLMFTTVGLGIPKLGLAWGNIDAATGDAAIDLVY
jgi:hypothetical protein